MAPALSRRFFLAAMGAALVAPRGLWAKAPEGLDHIILGVNDLDRGIAFVEEKTGVRAAFGGVHPGRGTQNALLSLGEQRYLEIIAPDPKQNVPPQIPGLRELTEPRLVGWAVHTDDIAAVAKRVTSAGIAIAEIRDGSRARPDGKTLRWKSFSLKDDRHGLLPFFIEWTRDSVHPSADAPAGCGLAHFSIGSPDPAELRRTLQALGIDWPVELSSKPRIVAHLWSSRSRRALDLSS
jgi:catechol 2,3-dioxygenase-like lactoylglutathione lyase family enzyme